MTILFLHGWTSVPGGLKPTYLKDHGQTVINPKLPDEDFDEAVRIAQAEFDKHQPSVVVGSSRGGAVAMNIDSGDARLVLLCPAWKRWGAANTVKASTVILHSRNDDVIPFTESEELVRNSGLPAYTLIEVGTDHRLADAESLERVLKECELVTPKILGCDFGAPKQAGDQANKIIVIEALQLASKQYAVRASGRNRRLAQWGIGREGWPYDRPGWTLPELRDSLIADESLYVGAFDFPFSLPLSLLTSADFAHRMNHPAAFCTRLQWADFVAARLHLSFTNDRASGEMTDIALFNVWRDKALWHRRACDFATRGSPPLKHVGQNLFAMTLAGASFLHAMKASGYCLLEGDSAAEGCRVLLETYPSLVARRIGFKGSYKTDSVRCLAEALAFLARKGIQLNFAPEIRRFCETYRTGSKRDDPDGADAFLCLVAAICFREGIAEVVSGEATPCQLGEEGGIVAPRSEAD